VKKKTKDPSLTGKPDLSLTKRITKIYKFYHPGKWMKSKVDEHEMWSCCASEFKESQVILIFLCSKIGLPSNCKR